MQHLLLLYVEPVPEIPETAFHLEASNSLHEVLNQKNSFCYETYLCTFCILNLLCILVSFLETFLVYADQPSSAFKNNFMSPFAKHSKISPCYARPQW